MLTFYWPVEPATSLHPLITSLCLAGSICLALQEKLGIRPRGLSMSCLPALYKTVPRHCSCSLWTFILKMARLVIKQIIDLLTSCLSSSHNPPSCQLGSFLPQVFQKMASDTVKKQQVTNGDFNKFSLRLFVIKIEKT